MKPRRLGFKQGFRVIPGNRRAQAAEMVILPATRKATRATSNAVSLLFIPRGERQVTGRNMAPRN